MNYEYVKNKRLVTKQRPLLFEDIVYSCENKKDLYLTILHHIDMDGIFSALVMKEALMTVPNPEVLHITFVPYNYQKDIKLSDIIPQNTDHLIIVDLSIPVADIESVYTSDRIKSIYMVDHHMTSLHQLNANNILDQFNDRLSIYVDISGCATMNVYNIFKNFTYYNSPNIALKDVINYRLIDLVDQYDRWDRKIEDGPLCDYLNTFCWGSNQLFVKSEIMDRLLIDNEYLNEAIKNGKKLYDLNQKVNEFKYEIFHREGILSINDTDYSVCYLFGYGSSDSFGKYIKNFDIVLLIRKPDLDENCALSMYTDNSKIDVSKICEHFGGGGHPKASGCTIPYKVLKTILK